MPFAHQACGFSLLVRQLALMLLFVVVLAGCQPKDTVSGSVIHQLQGKTMGTTWTIQLRAPLVPEFALAESGVQGVNDDEQPLTTLLAKIQLALEAELLRINQLMSTWDPDSELSLFNNARHVEPIELHADTLHVIESARKISHLTQGRYDITLLSGYGGLAQSLQRVFQLMKRLLKQWILLAQRYWFVVEVPYVNDIRC
jgi:thiamine biosynthesis lipoprotein ApbE